MLSLIQSVRRPIPIINPVNRTKFDSPVVTYYRETRVYCIYKLSKKEINATVCTL